VLASLVVAIPPPLPFPPGRDRPYLAAAEHRRDPSARRSPWRNCLRPDMTDEMLALAEANAAEAGVRNVQFLKATSRPSRSSRQVDVVIPTR